MCTLYLIYLISSEPTEAPVKRGRGRPRKVKPDVAPEATDAPKRRRGRPKKNPTPEESVDVEDETDGETEAPKPKKVAPATDTPKKGRGRPRKNQTTATKATKDSDDKEP